LVTELGARTPDSVIDSWKILLGLTSANPVRVQILTAVRTTLPEAGRAVSRIYGAGDEDMIDTASVSFISGKDKVTLVVAPGANESPVHV
jgi:hypothetical protein